MRVLRYPGAVSALIGSAYALAGSAGSGSSARKMNGMQKRTKGHLAIVAAELDKPPIEGDTLPFVGGPGPPRDDICVEGSLKLLGVLATTTSSNIMDAVIVPLSPAVLVVDDDDEEDQENRRGDDGGRGDGSRKRLRTDDPPPSPMASPRLPLSTLASLHMPPAAMRRVVVKYVSDCPERMSARAGAPPPRHPLVEEAIYLFTLNDGEFLVPPTLYLSPPGLLPPRAEVADRVLSRYLDVQYDRCRALGTEVRYIVQEKAGPALGTYFKFLRGRVRAGAVHATIYLRSVIAATVMVIRKLKILHELGIVHGDIHMNNVVVKNPVDDLAVIDLSRRSHDLVFIDFGLAEFFADKIGTDPIQPRTRQLTPELLSPWHLEEQRLGPRDDVFRAIEMMARFLAPRTFPAGISSLVERAAKVPTAAASARNREVAIRWIKTRSNFFKFSLQLKSQCCLEAGLLPSRLASVQEGLDSILARVRTYDHPDTMPEYDVIIRQLQAALALI